MVERDQETKLKIIFNRKSEEWETHSLHSPEHVTFSCAGTARGLPWDSSRFYHPPPVIPQDALTLVCAILVTLSTSQFLRPETLVSSLVLFFLVLKGFSSPKKQFSHPFRAVLTCGE